mmetsp:Transcript_13874/g.46933  ORF Transcript_13874/g.46933 Transcript_13874/m.46933 type:complete len:209 (+) Transcript_13874:1024-1650(+)
MLGDRAPHAAQRGAPLPGRAAPRAGDRRPGRGGHDHQNRGPGRGHRAVQARGRLVLQGLVVQPRHGRRARAAHADRGRRRGAARQARPRPAHLPAVRKVLWWHAAPDAHGGLRHGLLREAQPPRGQLLREPAARGAAEPGRARLRLPARPGRGARAPAQIRGPRPIRRPGQALAAPARGSAARALYGRSLALGNGGGWIRPGGKYDPV